MSCYADFVLSRFVGESAVFNAAVVVCFNKSFVFRGTVVGIVGTSGSGTQ